MQKKERLLKTLIVFFGFGYFSAYYLQMFTPIIALITITLSYYVIFKYNNFSPIIMLIVSARVLNGYILPSISGSYTIFMVLTYYLPIMLFIFRNIRVNKLKLRFSRKGWKNYGPAALYLIYILFAFLINISTAYALFLEGILPIMIFTICLFFLPHKKFDDVLEWMIIYFRMILALSIVIYMFPGYHAVTSELLLSGKVFGVSEEAVGTFIFQGIFRNNGIFFDCRILGIFTYIHLYLVGCKSKKISIFDVVLTSITVASTLSRGGIMVYLLVLFGYLLICENNKAKFVTLGIGGIAMLLVILLYLPSMSDKVLKFVSTLNLKNADNVLSQRSVMSDYALKAFRDNPVIGCGFGTLTSSSIDRTVYQDSHVVYTVVSDAYLFSLLGELGIIGTIFFIFQFYKTLIGYTHTKAMSLFLFAGMLIHMLGTDIPNMRLIYFVILILICIGNWNDEKSMAL